MSVVARAINAFEGAPAPDALRRAAIRFMVSGAHRALASYQGDELFAREMSGRPIAEHVEAANEQHYELPATFFELILGPRLKYSCCLFPTGVESLAQAESLALAETCVRADLHDGQDILELGCGWGSLSLWMAEALPNARILSVSNSRAQRAYIEARALRMGLSNLAVETADMNHFQAGRAFDRVVSVEMFEHMANWRALLNRVRGWLRPEGRLFLHVFSHRSACYRFSVGDSDDWIAQHFFTGGVMPSHGLIREFSDLFEPEADWRWSGTHYARTAEHWLANFDQNTLEIAAVLRDIYGPRASLWRRRWRLFFLATAGLFGHSDGAHWGVSHHRLRPT